MVDSPLGRRYPLFGDQKQNGPLNVSTQENLPLAAASNTEKARSDNRPVSGCVTTGTEWKSLKRIEQCCAIDLQDYFIVEMFKILAFSLHLLFHYF